MAADVHPSKDSCNLSSFIIERAFLVKETCLDLLFQCLVCLKCHSSPQNVAKYVDGDCLFVTAFCPSGHLVIRWSSRYAERIEKQSDNFTYRQAADLVCQTTNNVQEVPVNSQRETGGADTRQKRMSVEEATGDATHRLVSVTNMVKQGRMDQDKVDQEDTDQDDVPAEIIIKVEKEEILESPSEDAFTSTNQASFPDSAQMTTELQDNARVISYQNDLVSQENRQITMPWSSESGQATRGLKPVFHRRSNGEPSHKVPPREHTCSLCRKRFSRGYSLKIHESMHRRNNHRGHSSLSCAATGKSYHRRKKGISWRRHRCSHRVHLTRKLLKRRLPRHDVKEDIARESDGFLESVNSTASSSKNDENGSVIRDGVECYTCLKMFRSSSSCQKHQERHFPLGRKKLADVLKMTKKTRQQLLGKSVRGKNLLTGSDESSKRCRTCGKLLLSAFQKRVHECLHSESNLFQCQLCPRGFPFQSLLKDHLNIHIVDRYLSCKFCRKRFSSPEICQQHEGTHQSSAPFQCCFCQDFFTNIADRDEHEVINHSGETLLRCRFCHSLFQNWKVYRSHENKHVILEKGKEYQKNVEMKKENIETPDSSEDLSKVGDTSQDCCTEVKPSEYDANSRSTASSTDEHRHIASCCKFCGKQGLSSVGLETHVNIHRHVMPFRCQYCLKPFVARSTLMTHTNSAHGDECRVCHKRFKSPTVCQEHELIHHLIDQCEEQRANLTVKPLEVGHPVDANMHPEENADSGPGDGHMRQNTLVPNRGGQNKIYSEISQGANRPDTCILQPSVSGEKHQAQSPIEVVDEVIGVRGDESFEKRTYSSQTQHKISLKVQHIPEDVHTRPADEASSSNSSKSDIQSLCCRYCGKQLSSKTSRKYHERIHTGLKPHMCRFCPKAFSDGSMLRAHERIHTGEKPFSCSYCEKKFFQSSHKRSHERVHTGEKPYQCAFCTDRFSTSSCRHKHEERVHSLEKRYNCEYCSEVFTRSRVYSAHLKKHREEWSRMAANGEARYQSVNGDDSKKDRNEKSEAPVEPVKIIGKQECQDDPSVGKKERLLQTHRPVRKSYPCHFCDKILYAEGNRKVHERKHMSEWSIKCRFCDKSFPSAEMYKAHEVAHTGETPFRCRYCDEWFDQRQTRDTHEHVHTKDMDFTCCHCDMKFISRSECDAHEQLHSKKPYKCTYCERSFSFMPALEDHKITCGLVKPHRCNFCGQQFAFLKVYKSHLATHDEHRPFVCTKCGKTFKTTADVNKHELIHTEGTPYQCQFCDKAFKTTAGAKKHEQRHTKARAFQCRYCDKCFKTKPCRDVHERCHTGEKPYPCSYCGTRFGSITARKTHHLLHTGEVPHKCKYCNRPFRHNSSLTRHLRLHTGEKPYECKHCGDRFRDIKQCRNHELKHTGERPFMCSFCGNSFRDKMQLVKHERIHTGEKPYKCTYCDHRFPFYTSRKKHMERFHAENLKRDKEEADKLQEN